MQGNEENSTQSWQVTLNTSLKHLEQKQHYNRHEGWMHDKAGIALTLKVCVRVIMAECGPGDT